MRRRRSGLLIGFLGVTVGVAVLALGLAGPPDADAAARCQLPATGQTTCWDSAGNPISCAGTGQDGDIQAGKTLRYTDNGNGTITDMVTGLIWEKQSMDGSINDVGNTYTWDNAFAVHVADLNTVNFAGKHDWRLPNVKELQPIVDYENTSPAVDPAFNNNCTPGSTVLTGSCTQASPYWSSSTFASIPTFAWRANFLNGTPGSDTKTSSDFVRAVRGGCIN